MSFLIVQLIISDRILDSRSIGIPSNCNSIIQIPESSGERSKATSVNSQFILQHVVHHRISFRIQIIIISHLFVRQARYIYMHPIQFKAKISIHKSPRWLSVHPYPIPPSSSIPIHHPFNSQPPPILTYTPLPIPFPTT